MPLIEVFVRGGSSYRSENLAEGAHRALVDALGVPEDDRFIAVHRFPDGDLQLHPTFMGMNRSPEAVIVRVTLGVHRELPQKRLFSRLAQSLNETAGLRPDDLFVCLVGVPNENWSFGRGEAQLADAPPQW